MTYSDNNQIHVFDSSSNENKRRIPFKREFGKGKIKRMSCGLMLYKGTSKILQRDLSSAYSISGIKLYRKERY